MKRKARGCCAVSKVPYEQFENIVNPKVAYVLGFLWADGYISEKNNRIAIEITTKDFLYIEPILQSVGHWNVYHRSRPNRKPQSMATLTDNIKLTELLRDYDYCSKSASPSKILATIPDKLKHHWFRGLSDGDGCFYHGPINQPVEKRSLKHFTIGSTYEQDWSFVEQLMFELDITKYNLIKKTTVKDHKSSVIRFIGKKNITKFGKYIYRDFESCYLPRKYQKFVEISA